MSLAPNSVAGRFCFGMVAKSVRGGAAPTGCSLDIYKHYTYKPRTSKTGTPESAFLLTDFLEDPMTRTPERQPEPPRQTERRPALATLLERVGLELVPASEGYRAVKVKRAAAAKPDRQARRRRWSR